VVSTKPTDPPAAPGAQFSQVKAEGTEFVDCLLDGIGGVTSLRGASIRDADLVSLQQVFAKELGIEVG
jgi:uncharacterized protein YjbI with pentapeptide repeats